MAGATARTLFFTIFLSSSSFTHLSRRSNLIPLLTRSKPIINVPPPRFRTFCSIATALETSKTDHQTKHSILLEKLRLRHLKDSAKSSELKNKDQTKKNSSSSSGESENFDGVVVKKNKLFGSFEELGLSEEVMGSVREMGIEVPTEIQCIGVPAVLQESSVVLGSHTGSGKTLAYLLPLVQVYSFSFSMVHDSLVLISAHKFAFFEYLLHDTSIACKWLILVALCVR
ncbi:hypothetical protein S245_064627 [Arachis hypogaea]